MTKGPVARDESLWMVRAAAPLPQPVSPTSSSVESVGAMRWMSVKICRIGTEAPTRSPRRWSAAGLKLERLELRLEAQLHVADLEQRPGSQEALAHLRAVDEGAVGAAEILHEELLTLSADDQVVSTHRRVIEHHVVVGGLADAQRLAEIG